MDKNTLVFRSNKASPLTVVEADGNIDKLADGVTAAEATSTVAGISNATTPGKNMLLATTTQAQADLLPVFGTATKGVVPASGGGTSNYLRADGSWSAPAGGGGGTVTGPGSSVDNQLAQFNGTDGNAIEANALTGILKVATGVPAVAVADTDYATPTQTDSKISTHNAVTTGAHGMSAYGASLVDDANAGAAQTTLGISTFVKTILDDADAATVRATIGAGAGDVTGPAASAAGELAIYTGSTGKVLGRSSGNGLVKLTSGVASVATAETDYVTPSGTGTLTNKTLDVYTQLGSNVVTGTAIASTTIDISKARGTKTIAADTTFVFNTSPSNGYEFSVTLVNSDSNPHTITIPTSFSAILGTPITTFVIAAGDERRLFWYQSASRLTILGEQDIVITNDLLDTMDAGTVKGRITAGTGPVEDLDIVDVVDYAHENVASVAAAAGLTDISGTSSQNVTITGAVGPTTGLGTAPAGLTRHLVFASTPTFTYNGTSLILIGGKSRTFAAGDSSTMVSAGSGNWRETKFQPKNGNVPTAYTVAGLPAPGTVTKYTSVMIDEAAVSSVKMQPVKLISTYDIAGSSDIWKPDGRQIMFANGGNDSSPTHTLTLSTTSGTIGTLGTIPANLLTQVGTCLTYDILVRRGSGATAGTANINLKIGGVTVDTIAFAINATRATWISGRIWVRTGTSQVGTVNTSPNGQANISSGGNLAITATSAAAIVVDVDTGTSGDIFGIMGYSIGLE